MYTASLKSNFKSESVATGAKQAIFFTCYLLLFVIGGFLNYYGVAPFKMIYVSFFPFLLMFWVRVKIDMVFKFSLLFCFTIISSALINQTDLNLVILYLQQVITPFAMYFLAYAYLNKDNFHQVFRFSLYLSMIQLPLVLLQQAFYDELSGYGIRLVLREDFAAGTFYTSNDPALAFFLFGIILFLLFDKAHHHIVKNKGFVLMWLSFTILATYSKLSLAILVLIWIYYFITKANKNTILLILFIIPVLISILWFSGFREKIEMNLGGLTHHLSQFTGENYREAKEYFLAGEGNRVYALVYLFNEPLDVLGKGPFGSFDPATKKYHFGGDSGHLINTYINLGITGLFISYIFLLTFFTGKPFTQFTLIYFIVMCIFTLTVDVFTDPSFILAFHIFSSSYLLSGSSSVQT